MKREDWNSLSAAQKKQYFLDYYLRYAIAALAVAGLLVYTLITVTSPAPSYALRIGVYDASLSDETKQEMTEMIQEILNTDAMIEIDDAYNSNNDEDLMRIVSKSTEGKLDLIIANRETLEWLAGYGYFLDLSKTFTQETQQEYKDAFIECRGLLVEEGGLLTQDAEGNGPLYTAGIRLRDTKFHELLSTMSEPCLGVIAESSHVSELETLLQKIKQH